MAILDNFLLAIWVLVWTLVYFDFWLMLIITFCRLFDSHVLVFRRSLDFGVMWFNINLESLYKTCSIR